MLLWLHMPHPFGNWHRKKNRVHEASSTPPSRENPGLIAFHSRQSLLGSPQRVDSTAASCLHVLLGNGLQSQRPAILRGEPGPEVTG